MSNHYIRIDNSNRIIKGFSSEFEEPQQNDICINEDGGRHFEMLGRVNPQLTDPNLIYIYKYENGQMLERTQEEILQDLQAIPKEISKEDSVMLAIAELDAQREKDKLETQLAIAEAINSILGGVN